MTERKKIHIVSGDKEVVGDFDENFNGIGKIKERDGDRYKGEIHYQEPEGLGEKILASGLRYEGRFSKGTFVQGCLYLPDGTVLEADTWENNEIVGNGKLYYNDYRIYKGPFLHNLPNGLGKIIDENGKKNYFFFKCGKICSKDEMIQDSFDPVQVRKGLHSYDGGLINNQYHGFGTIYSDSGEIIRQGYFDSGVFIRGIVVGISHIFIGTFHDGDSFRKGVLINFIHFQGKLGIESIFKGRFMFNNLVKGTKILLDKSYEKGKFVNDKLVGYGHRAVIPESPENLYKFFISDYLPISYPVNFSFPCLKSKILSSLFSNCDFTERYFKIKL